MVQDTEELWADFATPIRDADDYIASLRGRRMNVYFMGERAPEPADHPVIRPSINAMAETFRLATEQPKLATVHSGISGQAINRFLHVPVAPGELVAKHELQRELGRRTGTCFQRCVGLDAQGSLVSLCCVCCFQLQVAARAAQFLCRVAQIQIRRKARLPRLELILLSRRLRVPALHVVSISR